MIPPSQSKMSNRFFTAFLFLLLLNGVNGGGGPSKEEELPLMAQYGIPSESSRWPGQFVSGEPIHEYHIHPPHTYRVFMVSGEAGNELDMGTRRYDCLTGSTGCFSPSKHFPGVTHLGGYPPANHKVVWYVMRKNPKYQKRADGQVDLRVINVFNRAEEMKRTGRIYPAETIQFDSLYHFTEYPGNVQV